MNETSEQDSVQDMAPDTAREWSHDVEPAARPDLSGRHPVNIGHLVMGIAFVGLAGIWLLFETESVQGEDLRWLLPLPWLAAGLAGLIGIGLTGRRSRPDQH
ncbi:hypothetical protein [Nocardioides piscis]|uniref:Uncharacterized protein n=1 Tax=Nocardioides piscis TaxID=2714938 RepID=A0A6G7YF23_9ACTN|nr:hypothetical protein [Nocardioides piscis]QIK75494.1 hypothetical protein G7071_08615 [Nocardioides piscis]